MKILFPLILLLSINSFSQQEVYIDENMKEITKSIYLEKCNAYIFKCLNYKTDSLIVNKVLYKYSFGNITTFEANQVRLLLMQKSKSEIDSNSIIIVKYRDTLFDFNTLKIKQDKLIKSHRLTNNGNNSTSINHKHKPLKEKRYLKNHYRYIKNQKKCVETAEKKYKTKVFYVYHFDLGHNKVFPELNWIKDNSFIKNKFFNIRNVYQTLILKPNGNYFLNGSILSNNRLISILTSSNWSNLIKDWKNSAYTNHIDGLGFFKRESYFEKNHCF